jgi:hypothetical protein
MLYRDATDQSSVNDMFGGRQFEDMYVNTTILQQQINHSTNLPCYTSSIWKKLRRSQPRNGKYTARDATGGGDIHSFLIGVLSYWCGLIEATITGLS